MWFGTPKMASNSSIPNYIKNTNHIDHRDSMLHVIAWLFIPAAIAGFLGSSTVLITLLFVRKLRTLSSIFIGNLVVCDLLLSTLIFPHFINNLLREPEINEVFLFQSVW